MYLIIIWLVTSVSLLIISRLNVGIGVANFSRALIAGLIIGLLNAVIGPAFGLAGSSPDVFSVSLVGLIINALLFWLAGTVVQGFWLRNGFWSALVGAVLLTVINAVIFWLLGVFGIG